jgi:hypothetical protein
MHVPCFLSHLSHCRITAAAVGADRIAVPPAVAAVDAAVDACMATTDGSSLERYPGDLRSHRTPFPLCELSLLPEDLCRAMPGTGRATVPPNCLSLHSPAGSTKSNVPPDVACVFSVRTASPHMLIQMHTKLRVLDCFDCSLNRYPYGFPFLVVLAAV